jgi:ATP-dependent Zn protease
LKNPEKYTNLGGKIQKEPTWGLRNQALLAKPLLEHKFRFLSGSDFVEMFVGLGFTCT